AGGTDAFKLVLAARSLGFRNSHKCNLDIDELEREVVADILPIVFLRVHIPEQAGLQTHAAVVVKLGTTVVLNDPLRQRLSLSPAEFLSEWNPTRRLAVIVKA